MVEPIHRDAFKYTYADILTWPENERWELIDGIAYDMTPAPSRRHQTILGKLHLQFGNYLEHAQCSVFITPFDVRLPEIKEDGMSAKTVVQPDLTVVCDREKLDERGCVGSPTLVLEIISPATVKIDLCEKLHAYEQAGVPEYWVVYPSDEVVNVFTLNAQGLYGSPMIYGDGEQVPVGVVAGLVVDLERVFAE